MKRPALQILAKSLMRRYLYGFPPIFLSPAGSMLWSDALLATKDLAGDVVEIGCYLGGTAAVSARLLKEIGSDKTYTVIDTFGGFVEEQFESELKLGGAAHLKQEFAKNTPELARWVLNRHGGADVKMVIGDIAKLSDTDIPATICACLIDIDLADPIFTALGRIYKRLVPGGIIIVDDCDNDTMYKARIGYERFITEHNLPREIKFGKGIVRAPSPQAA